MKKLSKLNIMKFIFNKIEPTIFMISLGLGLLICYLSVPRPEIIFKHPTPDNAGKIIYKNNKKNTCYKYDALEISCPKDGKIKKQEE